MKRIGVVSSPAVTWEKADLAKRFRRQPTEAEAEAWELLRGRRCQGLKFRRQQVVRGFIVDFYCAEHRLAIELDGGIHDQQTTEDALRDEALAEIGIRVLRVRNEDLSAQTLRALIIKANT